MWSSDLLRCQSTAGAAGLPFSTSEALREINFGHWEGRLWTDLHRDHADQTARFLRGDPAFSAPGGESISDLVTRQRRFVHDAGLLDSTGDIAVIGHGGALRALVVALLGLPEASTSRFYFDNCSLSMVSVMAHGQARLELLNDTAHLNGG